MAIFNVELSTRAKKDLRKVPAYIADKLDTWSTALKGKDWKK
jgi:hypothetical protein